MVLRRRGIHAGVALFTGVVVGPASFCNSVSPLVFAANAGARPAIGMDYMRWHHVGFLIGGATIIVSRRLCSLPRSAWYVAPRLSKLCGNLQHMGTVK